MATTDADDIEEVFTTYVISSFPQLICGGEHTKNYYMANQTLPRVFRALSCLYTITKRFLLHTNIRLTPGLKLASEDIEGTGGHQFICNYVALFVREI